MPRVAGLDLSLQASGVGVVTQRADGSTLVSASVIKSKGKRGASWFDRSVRIEEIANEVLHVAGTCELVLFEDLFTGPKAGSVIDRAGLLHRVVSGLRRREVPFASIVGTSLKSATTGSGASDKAAMTAAVLKLWPSFEVSSSDAVDGVAAAHLAAVRLGWDVPTLQRHRDAKVDWPELDPAEDAA